MAKINRWLLPEGVEEVLPKQAMQIEQFRRRVLDLYQSYGYELVIPPLIEYTESLLINAGSDMDLQTFKLTDQLTGRMMAVRADITTQTARIDAHSLKQDGATRLCYAGTVVQTKPKSQLASRVPIEVGAELYGDQSLYSDIEIISLMLATIEQAGVSDVHLDLGHVAIYRELVSAAGIGDDASEQLRDAFDRKAKSEVKTIVNEHAQDKGIASLLVALVDLHGDQSILAKARKQLVHAPTAVATALDDLQQVVDAIVSLNPATPVFIDLVELRGYQYHTGLVFAAYAPGIGHAVANGGRCDGIGEAYGRARPATGFSANVTSLLSIAPAIKRKKRILAPFSQNDRALQTIIIALRDKGEVVVQTLPDAAPENCDYQLVLESGSWQVKPLS